MREKISRDNLKNDRMSRTAIILRTNALVMCIYFLMLVIPFFLTSEKIIAFGSIAFFVAYVLLYYLCSTHDLRRAQLFHAILSLVFISVSIIMLGWDKGIQQFLLVEVMLLFISDVNKKTLRILFICFLGAIRLALYAYVTFYRPFIFIPGYIGNYYQLLNTVCVFVLFALALSVFSNSTREAENHLAVSVENNQFSQMIDLLTGLYNRGAIIQYLRDSVRVQQSFGEEHLTLALLDVDHFQKINQDYGQSPGDIILRQVGNQIKELLGEKGMVGRWSGTSFLLVMDGISAEEAGAFLFGVQQKIRAMQFTYHDESIQMTTTIALQAFDSTIDIDQNLVVAEKKLHTGKKAGGDTIVT